MFPTVGYLSPQNPSQTDQTQKPTDDRVYDGKEVDRKVQILSQPDPRYTTEAVRQNVVGVVKLKAVFTGDGEIKDIEVLNGLPDGLSENAVAVARKITFNPAVKDGKPVSVRMVLVYRFDLSDPIIHGQNFPKLYYDRDCRDYSNIAPNNMVFFKSEKEAKKAGYKKSKTCP